MQNPRPLFLIPTLSSKEMMDFGNNPTPGRLQQKGLLLPPLAKRVFEAQEQQLEHL